MTRPSGVRWPAGNHRAAFGRGGSKRQLSLISRYRAMKQKNGAADGGPGEVPAFATG